MRWVNLAACGLDALELSGCMAGQKSRKVSKLLRSSYWPRRYSRAAVIGLRRAAAASLRSAYPRPAGHDLPGLGRRFLKFNTNGK